MPKHSIIKRTLMSLTDREQLILASVVQNFVLTANPVGSRTLAKKFNIDLSSATIRNTMADLEDMGLLAQQHTSSGRVPTDMGYRLYVDGLMDLQELTYDEQRMITSHLENVSKETTNLYEQMGNLLSEITHLLSVISAPNIEYGTLDKIEIVRISSSRVMVVIVVSSGLIRTINLELDSNIKNHEIRIATTFINQRISGLKLTEIPKVIKQRLTGEEVSKNAIIRLFLDVPEMIFATETKPEVHYGYTRYILDQPEYNNPENLKGIIELLEDRSIIVHLLKTRSEGVTVTIGNENQSDKLKEASVITSTYRIGDVHGTLGIIGPTRMNYSRLMAITDYIAKIVSSQLNTK